MEGNKNGHIIHNIKQKESALKSADFLVFKYVDG